MAIVFSPIVYLVITTSRKEKKVKNAILKLAKANLLILKHLDLNGDLIVGLDATQKKLIYSSRKKISENFEIIDLNEQTSCVIKTQRTPKKYLEYVGIQLISPKTQKEIVFYAENEDDSPTTDPQMCLKEAEKWQLLIKPLLKAS